MVIVVIRMCWHTPKLLKIIPMPFSTEWLSILQIYLGDKVPQMSGYIKQSLPSLPIVQRYFTSTETIRTIRDGEPRTSTSTFTQLLRL